MLPVTIVWQSSVWHTGRGWLAGRTREERVLKQSRSMEREPPADQGCRQRDKAPNRGAVRKDFEREAVGALASSPLWVATSFLLAVSVSS